MVILLSTYEKQTVYPPPNYITCHVCLLLQVTVQVDDDIQRTGTTVGDFTTLASKIIYVGGMPSLFSQPSSFAGSSNPLMADNFRGCLKQVRVIPAFQSAFGAK